MPATKPKPIIAINCTLKSDESQQSSTDAMIATLGDAFAEHDLDISETIRIAAHNRQTGCHLRRRRGR